MKRAALLLLGLPIACAPDAPANQSGDVAAPAVESAPIAPARNELAMAKAPLPAPPTVSRETSRPRREAESEVMKGYRAIGTEPFWAVTVKDGILLLERPDQANLQVAVERRDDARAIRYASEGFTMNVTPGPCSDGMSDAIWSDRVQIAFAQGTLDGCGGRRDLAE